MRGQQWPRNGSRPAQHTSDIRIVQQPQHNTTPTTRTLRTLPKSALYDMPPHRANLQLEAEPAVTYVAASPDASSQPSAVSCCQPLNPRIPLGHVRRAQLLHGGLDPSIQHGTHEQTAQTRLKLAPETRRASCCGEVLGCWCISKC